jgi:beta-lactamase regulating signal transducer with metallopeptidase domain
MAGILDKPSVDTATATSSADLETSSADASSTPSTGASFLGMDEKQKTVAIIVLLSIVGILAVLAIYLGFHTCFVKKRLRREMEEQAKIDSKVTDMMKREVEQQNQKLLKMSEATMANNLGNPYLMPVDPPVEKKTGWFRKK